MLQRFWMVLLLALGYNVQPIKSFLTTHRIDTAPKNVLEKHHNIGNHRISFGLVLSVNDSNDDSDEDDTAEKESSINVLGSKLTPCCANVGGTGIGTGFYRNGYCSTGEQDLGRHTICVQVTDKFLEFSKSVGNDLSTPMPEYMFPGLKEGDIWVCLFSAFS